MTLTRLSEKKASRFPDVDLPLRQFAEVLEEEEAQGMLNWRRWWNN